MKKFLGEISSKVSIEDPFKIVESMGLPMIPTLIPGHLYALGIDPGFQVTSDLIPLNLQEYKENIGKKINITKRPYYDTMPIGIALRTNNENYQSILNFKLMSPQYRKFILESIYNLMEIQNSFISPYVKEDLSKVEVPIETRLKNQSYLEPFFAVSESFVKKVVGADISFAVKNYEINSIKKVRFLDWDTLPKIYNMSISDVGIVFNPQVGGLTSMFDMFESKFF
jgi:hypothetical protein